MRNLIRNLKARIYCKKFNVWTCKLDPKRKPDNFMSGDFYFDGEIFYGNRFFVFFSSNQNYWYKDVKNKP